MKYEDFIKEVEKHYPALISLPKVNKNHNLQLLSRIEVYEREEFLYGLSKGLNYHALMANFPSMRMVVINTDLTFFDLINHSIALSEACGYLIWGNDFLNWECIFSLP